MLSITSRLPERMVFIHAHRAAWCAADCPRSQNPNKASDHFLPPSGHEQSCMTRQAPDSSKAASHRGIMTASHRGPPPAKTRATTLKHTCRVQGGHV